MRAWKHPLNAASIADGRAEPPPLPRAFYWIALTARVNQMLGTNYKISEIQAMPGDELLTLGMWLEATHSPT